MQRDSYSAFHPTCGEQDVFSALAKVCLNPLQPLTEQGCGLEFTFDQQATHGIASTDLEPIPLADQTGAPALYCQSYVARDLLLQASPLARQVTPTPITSAYRASVDHSEGVTFRFGQPVANENHLVLESVLTCPDIVSSSIPNPNFQRCDSILFSSHGVSLPSSPAKYGGHKILWIPKAIP